MKTVAGSLRSGNSTLLKKRALAKDAALQEQYGLEFPLQLEWRKWHPGSEYVKQLVVKNVSTRVIRVSYKLTHTKVFSMDFPEPIKLSPGMSCNLRVVFRPVHAQVYEDSVEICCDDGAFVVPMRALLPHAALQAPPSVDFGLVPAKETAKHTFSIKNTGDMQLAFTWKLDAPFAIEPSSGQLGPGQSACMTAVFQPQDAAGFTASAACMLDSGVQVIVKVAGIAKFPYLSVEAPEADLGDVVVGQSRQVQLRFGNHSQVPAHFVVAHGEGPVDGVFTVSPTEGTLGPGEYSALTLTYTPKSAGMFSCEPYTLSTPGGNRLTLTLRGNAASPRVILSARALNFGNVRSGKAPAKVLYLENQSPVPVVYEFQGTDGPGDAFCVDKARGVVPAYSMGHVSVAFRGSSPAVYWRRILCVIKDAEPIAVDLLATCYDDKSRPPPLSHRHVATYLARVAAGLDPVPSDLASTSAPASAGGPMTGGPLGFTWGLDALHSPREGDAAPGSPSAVQQGSSSLKAAPGSPSAQPSSSSLKGAPGSPAMQLGNASMNSSAGAVQGGAGFGATMQGSGGSSGMMGTGAMLASGGGMPVATAGVLQTLPGPDSWDALFGADLGSGISVDVRVLDFGASSKMVAAEQKSVTVTNNTSAKLLAFVTVPTWEDPNSGGSHVAFQVFPETAEIKAHGSATFRVAFRPARDGAFFCQQLQVCAFVKAMRNFRLVSDAQVVPPWSIPVLASANTFLSVNPEYSPKVALSAPALSFPPCRLGQASYQTMALSNYGDTPVHFAFQPSELAPNFVVKPQQGVVPPHTQQLVCFRFVPSSTVPVNTKATIIYNNASVNTAELLLRGSGHDPALALDCGSSLFFRPTCAGASSSRTVTVRNTSRVPVAWRWVLSKLLQEAVAVEPKAGVLRGNENCQVTFTFSPPRQRIYEARAALVLLPPSALAAQTRLGMPGLIDASGLLSPGSMSGSYAAAGNSNGNYGAGATLTVLAADGSTVVSELPDVPEGAEKLIVNVVGESREGVLSLEPADLDFGPLRVGYPETRQLRLSNQSEGVLRYSLEVVLLPADDGADDAAAQTPVDFDTAQQQLRMSSGGGAMGSIGSSSSRPGSCVSLLANGTKVPVSSSCLECWVDESEGAIGARSSKTVTLTLHPRFRRRYRVALHCRASTVAPVMRTSSSGSMAPVGATVGPALGASDAAAGMLQMQQMRLSNGGGSGALVGGLAVAQGPPLAEAQVGADAAFPALMVTDVRSDGLPKQVVWQMLGLPEVNAELQSPVSPAELELHRLFLNGALTSAAACKALKPFLLDFGSLPLECMPRVVAVRVLNSGALPVSWELDSYDDPQVELENWVEASKPSTAAERARAFVVENKVFEVFPRSGTLQPGESQQVTLAYSPVAIGAHELALFLSIGDGKRLYFKLCGQTVPYEAQLPLLLPSELQYALAPVPIGELQPPLQSYCLRNGGAVPLSYSLDLSALGAMARDAYGFEVLRFASANAEGEIPPGGVAMFNWQFQPLEPKLYTAQLPVVLGDGSTKVLCINGRGYHPKEAEAGWPTAQELARYWQGWQGFSPSPQLAPSPERPLVVSQEVLSLGTTLLQTGLTRRLLRLSNEGRWPLVFAWDLGVFEEACQAISGRLSIQPPTGTLDAGESVVCQLSFQGGLQPQIFEGEIFCYGRVDEDALAGMQQYDSEALLPEPVWGRLGSSSSSSRQQGDEEIIAEHPPRQHMLHRGDKLRTRLPLHLSMTLATCNRLPRLKAQFEQTLATQLNTLNTLSSQRHGTQHPSRSPSPGFGTALAPGSPTATAAAAAAAAEEAAAAAVPPGPQLLTVTLTGRVLGKGHIKARSYVPAAEVEEAMRLLSVPDLSPAEAGQPPVYLPLPDPAASKPSSPPPATRAPSPPKAPAKVWETRRNDRLTQLVSKQQPGSGKQAAADRPQATAADAAPARTSSSAAEGAGSSTSGTTEPAGESSGEFLHGSETAAADASETPEQQQSAASAAHQQPLQAKDGLEVVGGVLQELVRDVWADDDVAAAFKNLQPEPHTTFAEMRRQSRQQKEVASSSRNGKWLSPAPSASSRSTPTKQLGGAAGSADASRAGSRLGFAAAGSTDGSRAGSRLAFAAGSGAVASGAMAAAKGDAVAATLQQPEFQQFADMVLDSALVGAMQEGVLEQQVAVAQQRQQRQLAAEAQKGQKQQKQPSPARQTRAPAAANKHSTFGRN